MYKNTKLGKESNKKIMKSLVAVTQTHTHTHKKSF